MLSFLAVLITILSASSVNIGKALQKKGTKNLPKLSFQRNIVKTYFENKHWRVGMILDIFGGLLMLIALALAPVSVVQPVAAGGVCVLAWFSHVFLDERISEKEWVGVFLAVLGTCGIGWTSTQKTTTIKKTENVNDDDHFVGFWRCMFGVLVVLSATMFLISPELKQKMKTIQQSSNINNNQTPGTTPIKGKTGKGSKNDHFLKSPDSQKGIVVSDGVDTKKAQTLNDGSTINGGAGISLHTNNNSESEQFKQQRFKDIVAGARAGALFSLSASSVKLGFQLAKEVSFIWALLGLIGSIALTGLGLFSQTKGLKEGNAVVVVCSGNVAQMVTAIPFGIIVLNEKLPYTTFRTFVAFALSWWMILFGVCIVSGLSSSDVIATFAINGGDKRKSVVLPTTISEAKAMLNKSIKKGGGGVGRKHDKGSE